MNLDHLLADLKSEEGWRASVYDDSNGQPITKGTLVKGYPTVGYGFCVDAFKGAPLPQEVADFWLQHLVEKVTAEIESSWQPYVTQHEDVQRALVQMAYQLGVSGLLGFKLMLAALERGDRETAAENALDSTWHTQTPARAERVAALIRGET